MRKVFTIICLFFIMISGEFYFCRAFAEETAAFKPAKTHEAMIPVKVLRKIQLPPGGYHEGLFIENNNIFVNNGQGGSTWVIDLKSGKKISEISPVGTFSEGISRASEGRYYVTDWNAKKLYLVKIEKNRMTAETEISFAPAHPTGVIWNGVNLYVITWTRGVGTVYHLIKMDCDGNILDKHKIQNISEPTQLAWDGKDLWISSWFNRRVYRIDPETLEIKGYFRSGIEQTTGIAWDGKNFWVTGTNTGLYQLEVSPASE